MKNISKALLEIKAIFLRPDDWFEWTKGGLKGPMYCDNRLIPSYPKIRDLVVKAMTKTIKEKYPNAEKIVGVSTAGIWIAALIAKELDIPMLWARATTKDYGRANSIEGKINPGDKVVVIEDLVASGNSTIEVVKNLKEINVDVLGSICIYTYNLPVSHQNFKKEDQSYIYLTDFNELIEVALEHNYINKNDIKILTDWKKEYDVSTMKG